MNCNMDRVVSACECERPSGWTLGALHQDDLRQLGDKMVHLHNGGYNLGQQAEHCFKKYVKNMRSAHEVTTA